MNRNKAIQELKTSWKKLVKFADESKFNNFVLTDGTQITVKGQDLEVGVEVYQLDENQNQTPLDPGTYVLNDGRTFTVDATNKVTEVGAPDDSDATAESGDDSDNAEVETSKEKLATDNVPAGHGDADQDGSDVEHDESKDGDLASRVEDIEKTLAEIVNFLQKIQDSQQEVNEQMMHKIRRIGAESGDIAIKTLSKSGFESYKSEKVSSIQENTESFLDKIRSIKMKKDHPSTKEVKGNSFKKMLQDADAQIKTQTMAKVEVKALIGQPTNENTESFLTRIRSKK
jgi:hypothetical protein